MKITWKKPPLRMTAVNDNLHHGDLNREHHIKQRLLRLTHDIKFHCYAYVNPDLIKARIKIELEILRNISKEISL